MDIITYPSSQLDNYVDMLWGERLFQEIVLSPETTDEKYFKCKKSQTFIKRVFVRNADCNSMLLFHTMGSGKTDCSMIAYDNLSSTFRKVVYLVKGPGNTMHIKSTIKMWLKRYKDISEQDQDAYIKDNIEFQKFISFTKRTAREKRSMTEAYSNCLFIIDEVHNLRIDSLEDEKTHKTIFFSLVIFLKSLKNVRVILMTGTPMYDNTNELRSLGMFLHLDNPGASPSSRATGTRIKHAHDGGNRGPMFDIDKALTEMPLDKLYKNKTSYCNVVDGKPAIEYVENENGKKLREGGHTKYKLVVLEMKGKQLAEYKKYNKEGLKMLKSGNANELDVFDDYNDSSDDYNDSKSRRLSDIEEPSNVLEQVIRDKAENSFMRRLQSVSLGVAGAFSYCNKESMQEINQRMYGNKSSYKMTEEMSAFFGPKCRDKQMEEYSIKFAELERNINNYPGTAYVFSELVGGFGVKFFAAMFVEAGYEIATTSSMYNSNETLKEGRRVMVVTGVETGTDIKRTEQLCKIFNSPDNVDGKYIKIFIGSVTTGEGWNLKNVRQVHVLTPHWNINRINQVEGRVARTHSHDGLGPGKDKKVLIFRYVAIAEPIDVICEREALLKSDSADLHKYTLSERKEEGIQKLENDLMNNSIDKYLSNNKSLRRLPKSKVNSLYINYYREFFMEKLSKILYDRFREADNRSASNPTIQSIQSDTDDRSASSETDNRSASPSRTSSPGIIDLDTIARDTLVDKAAVEVLLYEMCYNNKFIHVNGASYLLKHSDGTFRMVKVESPSETPTPNLRRYKKQVVNRRIDKTVYKMFDKVKCRKKEMIELLKKTEPSSVAEALRLAIRYNNEDVLKFLRNMWFKSKNGTWVLLPKIATRRRLALPKQCTSTGAVYIDRSSVLPFLERPIIKALSYARVITAPYKTFTHQPVL
ncbi:unnamed protein product [Sphagnum troendelagicum]